MKLLSRRGFTLVELIVVITILSILGTIAFATMSSWSTSSRNAVRIADLGTISHGLEIFIATHSSYPKPDASTTITFSGANVWEQGVFGANAVQNMASIPRAPQDPLDETAYAYSTTSRGNEYELGGMLENGSYISSNPIYPQAYANTSRALYVNGNYNGNAILVDSGAGIHYLLAVPTILATNLDSADLVQIIQNSRLAMNGMNTPPSGIAGTPTEVFHFNQANPSSILVWSGSLSTVNTKQEKLIIAERIKVAYLTDNTAGAEHAKFRSIDTSTDPQSAQALVEGLLIGQLRLDGIVSYEATTEPPQGNPGNSNSITISCVEKDFSSRNRSAFAALKADGSITAWGSPTGGGSGAPTDDGYVAIYSARNGAFAALKADGSVAAWGSSTAGGSGAPTGTGYFEIHSTNRAFAALNADGHIASWGNSSYGGAGAPTDSGYTKLFSNSAAFAALKPDGSISVWGDPVMGGSGAPIDSGYTTIYGNNSAFAALKSDGSISVWGDPAMGGSGAPAGIGFISIRSAYGAFAALKNNGTVVSWGDSNGGTGAPTDSGYTEIFSNSAAFAALKADGSISAWGSALTGGNSAPTGMGFTSIHSSSYAFAALDLSGSITTWGATSGAPTNPGYTDIHATELAFAALNSDGTTAAWGNASYGGAGAPTDSGYIVIHSHSQAFSARKADGTVSAWGSSSYGGSGAPTDSGYAKFADECP